MGSLSFLFNHGRTISETLRRLVTRQQLPAEAPSEEEQADPPMAPGELREVMDDMMRRIGQLEEDTRRQGEQTNDAVESLELCLEFMNLRLGN